MKHPDNQIQVAVIYSLPTERAIASEYAATDLDTAQSARRVINALNSAGFGTSGIPVSEHSIESLSGIKADCILNMIEWTGHDLELSRQCFAVLEALKIPFTGAGWESYYLTDDKISMKRMFDRCGIPTAPWFVYDGTAVDINRNLNYPLILKPALEHCSIGLSPDAIVHSRTDLTEKLSSQSRKFSQPVICEEFIDGDEYHLVMLEGDRETEILPPVRFLFDKTNTDAFLTYNSRWNTSHPEFKNSHIRLIMPEADDFAVMSDICRQAFISADVHDYARVDLRVRNKKVFVLEINSNPGLDDDDEYELTMAYKAAGMTFDTFLRRIILSCLRRFGVS